MPFQEYSPFFRPEELDALTAADNSAWHVRQEFGGKSGSRREACTARCDEFVNVHDKFATRSRARPTIIEGQMTLYRGTLETVEAFQYQAALETMDFKYPFPDWLRDVVPDWLRDVVTVRENAILQLDTDFGVVWVKPGQWVVKHSRGNLDILEPEEFHRRYRAVSD